MQRVIGHRFEELSPCNSIRAVNCPVLLVHGTSDDTVPVGDALEIYGRRRDDRVRLPLIPGSHDQFAGMAHSIGEVIGFLDGVMSTPGQRRSESSEAKSGGRQFRKAIG